MCVYFVITMLGNSNSPFIKSLLNLGVDYSGRFFFRLKRLKSARTFLVNLNILNRVRPRSLSDLMIQKRRLPYSKRGRFNILRRAFLLFYGIKEGNTKAFLKRNHLVFKKIHKYREDFLVRYFLCNLSFFVYSLKFFDSIKEAQYYIKTFGIFLNDTLVKDISLTLKPLDIISFCSEHRFFFKLRFYYYFSSSFFFSSYYERALKLFYSQIYGSHNLLNFNIPLVSNSLITGNARYVFKDFKSIAASVQFLNGECLSELSENYTNALALFFRRRRLVLGWKRSRPGHFTNLERVFTHRLSVSPYRFDRLMFRFVSRLFRFTSRKFVFKGLRRKNRRKFCFKRFRSSSFRTMIFDSIVRRRPQIRRLILKNKRRKRRWIFFFKYFGYPYTSNYTNLRVPLKKFKIKNLKSKPKLVLFFFKDCVRSVLRLFFWRLKRFRLFSLLCRLSIKHLNFFFALLPDNNLNFLSRTALSKNISLSFDLIFYKHMQLVSRLLNSFFLLKSVNCFVLPFFFKNYVKRLFYLRKKSLLSHIEHKLSLSPMTVGRGFFNEKTKFCIRKKGCTWGWRSRFVWVLKNNVQDFPVFFCQKFFYYFPLFFFHQLNLKFTYDRFPFQRSEFFRFYRLHPRFSSIFFVNFLPRFVEPSFRSFEFLIRPVQFTFRDLRLPFKLKKKNKLNLLMSFL